MKDFWNKRYDETTFSYGILPNRFFKQELDKLTPGSILLPAEGEGRNAVYAARKGWNVEAFDLSESGKRKAMQLADNQQVTISYEVTNALDFSSDTKFDVLALIYAHLPKDLRARVHRHMLQFLNPNGLVIFEAFSKGQLGRDSGGPKSLEMLFSLEDIRNEFEDLDFKFLEEADIQLKEGIYHNGDASIIRFVGHRSS